MIGAGRTECEALLRSKEAPPDGGKNMVAVIDDDETDLKVVAAMLGQTGCHTPCRPRRCR